jgi:polysaccharide deacetylase family protein (PEP-CTERM system associated)
VGLLEIPVTTARVLKTNLPAAGGGYFRLLPYPVSRALIRSVNKTDRRAAVFYFHPWELDPGQPRIAGTSLKTRFRHYLNLDRMEARLRSLLRDFKWRRLDQVFLDAKIG